MNGATRNPLSLAWLTLAVAFLVGCSAGSEADAPALARGKAVYGNVCIACHHGDPTRDGALGPAVAGASRELIEAKTLRGEYPPGYQPRRAGAVMPTYPQLAEAIDDLAAYLAHSAN